MKTQVLNADKPSITLAAELLKKGELVGIMGKNGAGKTSLIRTLNGLIRPTHGNVFIENENINSKSIATLSTKVGIIFQNPFHQLFAITVEEDQTITAMAVIKSKDNSFYPAFLHLDPQKGGQILGVYFIAEKEEQFDLIPFEVAKEFLNKSEEELLPLQYRTLEKIVGDQYQKNWPDFS